CIAVVSGRTPEPSPQWKATRLKTNSSAAAGCLGQGDVFSLQTLRSLLHNERDPCAFIERTVSARGDGGEMDEDILPIFALDKAKTFSRVKPLDSSCFFHLSSFLAIPGFLPDRLSIVPRGALNFTSALKGIQTMREDLKSPFNLACLSPPRR